jgi:hypothetical protein
MRNWRHSRTKLPELKDFSRLRTQFLQIAFFPPVRRASLRDSGSPASLRGCAPAWVLLFCLIAILSACSKARGPASKSGTIPRSANGLREFIKPDSRIYPFSVIPGGVRDGADVAEVRRADAVVRAHYGDIGASLAPHTLVRDQWLYASYRVGSSVYWTRQKVRVRAGETALTDGIHMIRGRCGNRLSRAPGQPTRFLDPPSRL